MDKYLVYSRDTPRGVRFTHMEEEAYDKWYLHNPKERHNYPVVARGLTLKVAKKMVELTHEEE